MPKRLQKRQRHWTENFSREEVLELTHRRFSGIGWQRLQRRFDALNEQFFQGVLPKIFIITGIKSSQSGGTYYGKSIFVSDASPIDQEKILLHEMLHLHNNMCNIFDSDHGKNWATSMKPIFKKLNINLNPSVLTQKELLDFPYSLFENYGLDYYFERSWKEFGEFRALPTGWQLEPKRPNTKKQIEVICQGDALADFEALSQVFDEKYIYKLKEIICNTRY